MAASANPLAPHHLPWFITPPGQTDVLFNVMLVIVVGGIVLVGVLYFKLHALPEQVAHKGLKFQYDLVAVLALISLFTHNHIFWIAGLLFAFVPIPDFLTPMRGMANSLQTMASGMTRRSRVGPPEVEPPEVELSKVELPEVEPPEVNDTSVTPTIRKEVVIRPLKGKGRTHA